MQFHLVFPLLKKIVTGVQIAHAFARFLRTEESLSVNCNIQGTTSPELDTADTVG